MNNNLDTTSLILQLYSVILLLQDYNNSDLMQELQRQDKEYLEKIFANNIDKEINLDMLCSRFNTNRTSLSKLIKEKTA